MKLFKLEKATKRNTTIALVVGLPFLAFVLGLAVYLLGIIQGKL